MRDRAVKLIFIMSPHTEMYVEKLREPIDKLELIVDKAYWPVPSYSDLMFEV